MQGRLRFLLTLVALTAVASPAIRSRALLGRRDQKKPAYARALKSLLDHAGNLPDWTREALKPKGFIVESPATHVTIHGITYDLFTECQPHSCNVALLVIMFSPNGTQAWGILVNEGISSFLGEPSDAKQAVLRGSLPYVID